MKQVEIIAIGNELLIGDVLDTNTNWLCRRLTMMGAFVRRAVLVRDDEDAITTEIKGAISRKTNLLFTSGGLGPTDDDRTVAAVAKALGRPLELNEQALKMVERRYRELHEQGFVDSPEITPARKKMAILPQGSVPLFNPVGTAPGVWLDAGTIAVVCLPGVPAELKGVFENSLPTFLEQAIGKGFFSERVFEATCKDESVLAPLLKKVADKHTSVYLKSKARTFGEEVHIRILFAASGSDKESVEGLLQAAIDDLLAELEPYGIVLVPITEG
ncbi:MAG: competence/damage-inducible protein A [Candidatus Fervidibacter sp.]|uniref:competence/damage-inducible protein A n=1 Tax=Candidatus Fervidibacter sp. TaxID=3100871 RepID=UPI00404A78CC